jgi:hypothetical protein
MASLVWQSYRSLIHFEFYLRRGNFQALDTKVRTYPLRTSARTVRSAQEICRAMDLACIWYPKEVLCLQRSASTACLLKAHGVAAEMVIGAQQIPFKAHAWVEVNGEVVNDKPYMSEMYAVLDRC